MTILLTRKQRTILRLKSQGMSNAEISRKLKVTPVDITQTFRGISKKVTSVSDTLQMMKEIGFIQKSPSIELTKKGMASLDDVTKIGMKQTKQKFSRTSHTLPLVHREKIQNGMPGFLNKYKSDMIPENPIEFWKYESHTFTHTRIQKFNIAHPQTAKIKVSSRL